MDDSRSYGKKVSLLSVTFGLVLSIQPQITYADSQGVALEEIVVTARKRTESLQDVPVSVNAINADKLNDAGLTKIEDLSSHIPNLTFSETGLGSEIFIRGIGSGFNQGFERSVGMYVDGIYYGRSQLQRAPFLDLAQVEVLRGPQGVLFGKNSIAGAISMITAKPTQEIESSFNVMYEPERNEQEIRAIYSAPITDELSARFAFRRKESEGYIDNITLNNSEPVKDEQTIRLSMDWNPTEDLNIFLKVEDGLYDRRGREIEIVRDDPGALGTYADILSSFGEDATVQNNSFDGKRSANGDFNNTESDNFTLNVNYELEDLTLTAITGVMGYEYEEECDCDFTAANVFTVFSDEKFDQFSQEIRLTSPAGETFDYIGGMFFQHSEFTFHDGIYTDAESVIGAITGPNGVDVRTPRLFEQETDVMAIFGQVTWSLSDVIRLNFGGRVTSEEKEAYRDLTFQHSDPTQTLADPADTRRIFAEFFLAEEHVLKGKRKTTKFTPAFSAQYDGFDDMMLYTSIAKGFKSGGFDARANTAPNSAVRTGSFEFDDEEAITFEIGSKATLANGAAELNSAFFITRFDDMQVSIYDGVFGFNVDNAAKSTSMGVEFDGRWRASENFFFAGSLGYLDFKWDEFSNGQCPFGDEPDSVGADGTEYCDYKGKSNRYVANWSGNISANYEVYFEGMLFRFNTDILYSSDYLLTQNLDPKASQDAYTKVNAMIALGDADESWAVSVIGNNLTDEDIFTNADDTPLAGDNLGAGGHFAVIAPPRTFSLNIGMKF